MSASYSIPWRCLSLLLLIPLVLASDLRGQEPSAVDEKVENASVDAGHSFHGEAFDEGPRQAAYLMNGMGNVHWKISTKSPLAQRFFDQAISQMHGFWYFEAERSFRQVAALDPECAMAYWGMARANTKNEKRARGFIAEAVKRKANGQDWERRLIEALDAQLTEKVDGKVVVKKKRFETYAKTLEEISLDYPDQVELKALLVLQLWENEREGLPLQSRKAVDAILSDIFERNPRHPAHHFRIHLWDNSRRELALASAAAGGPASPGIAHMWHMPGHTYSGLRRYHDAAWQQEASARVDHAHMMRDRVMPDQIHNFAHNNEWLIRTWIKTGEVDKALSLAKNMCELPRHPKYNTLDKGSANFGRSRLISLLTTYGLWHELVSLADTPYLEPTDTEQRQEERLAWLAVGSFMSGSAEKGMKASDEIDKRLTEARLQYRKLTTELQSIASSKPPTKPKSGSNTSKQRGAPASNRPPSIEQPIALDELDWDEVKPKANPKSDPKATAESKWDDVATKDWTKPQQAQAKDHAKLKTRIEKLDTYTHLVRAYRAAADKRFGDAIASARPAGSLIPVHDRIEWYANLGQFKTALAKCRERINASPNEVLPLAHGAWIAWQAQDKEQSRKWIEELAKIVHACDPKLEQIDRLRPIVAEFGLTDAFTRVPEPADDLGERPELDSLGPARWSPYEAPFWSLTDSKGSSVSSSHSR